MLIEGLVVVLLVLLVFIIWAVVRYLTLPPEKRARFLAGKPVEGERCPDCGGPLVQTLKDKMGLEARWTCTECGTRVNTRGQKVSG
jgi:ribosomal protein S27AE